MDEEFTPQEADRAEESEQQGKSISSDLIRGHINTIILRSLYDGDKYGYEILAEIERKSHGQYELKQPSLYSALKRLEKDGYITSYWGGSVSGGRRKYFSLTDEGKLVSEQNQAEWEYSRTVIDSLISDKDFDFSNPAPTPVNMRVLKSATSRTIPLGESEEEDFEGGAERERLERELEERNAALDERQTALDQESARIAEQIAALDERRKAIDEKSARLEEETVRYEAEMQARNDALLREREWREAEIAERERRLEEERKKLGGQTQLAPEEIRALEERIRTQEREIAEQRAYYEELLSKQEQQFEEERARHAEELEAQRQQILDEQAALFREREQQLLHQNYIDLISTPPRETEAQEYSYITPPAPAEEETVQDVPTDTNESAGDYRSVVRRIYANSVKPESETEEQPAEGDATVLGGMDFADLKARAARDGIKIVTTGEKSKPEQRSANMVHKGKALFLSAIAVFIFLVAFGSILLGIREKVAVPLAFPYFIWGVGLALLLVTGLAFANHYGERTLRTSTRVIVDSVVLYVLCVIVTLIVALSVNIDFTNPSKLMAFVVIPVVFFFGIVIFGVVYYLETRPNQK